MKERRGYNRFDIEITLILKSTEEDGREWRGRLFDVSFSGLGAKMEEDMEAGLQVTAEVRDAPFLTRPLALGLADVVHVRHPTPPDATYKCHVGVRFTKPDADSIDSIIRTIQTENMSRSRKQRDGGKPRDVNLWF